MLDPIVNFFTWIFQWIGRGIGFVIGIILWPFLWAGRWYTQRGWILKSVLGVALVGLVGALRLFLLDHAASGRTSTRTMPTPTSSTRAPSRPAKQVTTEVPAPRARPRPADARRIADVTADLTDFNVNQNRLGLVDDPLQARPVRHATGTTRRSSTTRRRSSAASTRPSAAPRSNSSTISAACAAPAQIDPNLQDARGNHPVRRGHLVFRPQPVRPEDADAQLLPHRRSTICAPSTTGCEAARWCSMRAPTI